MFEPDGGNVDPSGVTNAYAAGARQNGLWGREVAALAGLELPLQPTEHQYFVTETIAEIDALDRRLPSVADRDGEYYLRQEGKGLLVGAYERDMRFWAESGTPLDFAHDLFPDDLERIEDNMMRAIRSRARRWNGRYQARHKWSDDLVAGQQCFVGAGA
ncbi:Dimethylglycine dehydrogenase, mitochondrial [Nymphon striatum]|nr:Dimethylglycine dehydrogenase, mitochondrial [Nymphon striatum]